MTKVRVTVAEALAQTFLREDMDTVFGIPSGYSSVFLDAARRGGMRAITNLHECAAGFAAAGYTLASGKPGVVYGQAGPGVTNMVTSLAAAYADSVPQFLLATQAPSRLYGREGHQEASGGIHGVDQLDAFRSVSAVRFRPTNGDTAIRCSRRAIAAVTGRRSTGVVEVASDMWGQQVDHEDLAPSEYRTDSAPVDMHGIEQVLEMLRTAKRPALLVGHRAVHRGTARELLALCEAQDLPVATVDYAKGAIPEDHPLWLGLLSSCGHDSVVAYLAEADLVIALGARMTTTTTLDFDPRLFKNLVHIDDLAEEPGRNFKLKLGILSDLAGTIRALKAGSTTPVHRGSAERVRALRVEHGVYGTPKGRPNTSTPAVLSAIREIAPRDTLVAGDSGLTLQYLKHFFPVYAPDGFYALYSLAAMGSGLPLAIGVQLARPEQPVLCVIGDGGTLVHLSELAVAAHYGLPLVTVIINNGGYKQVADRQARYQKTTFACEIPQVDFVAVARGCGCDAYQAEDADGAAAAVKTALQRRKAAVVEVRVQGDNLFDITPPQITKLWDTMFEANPTSTEWPFKK